MNHKASKESMETLVGETNLTAMNNTLGETQRIQKLNIYTQSANNFDILIF